MLFSSLVVAIWRCAMAVVSAVITRPWLPAMGIEQRTVGSECKVVFLVCDVGEHQCTGFGGALVRWQMSRESLL